MPLERGQDLPRVVLARPPPDAAGGVEGCGCEQRAAGRPGDPSYSSGVRVVERCSLISHLANIGDTRSLILHPASTTHRQLGDAQRIAAGAGDDVVRLSVGLETADDIIADLRGALA